MLMSKRLFVGTCVVATVILALVLCMGQTMTIKGPQVANVTTTGYFTLSGSPLRNSFGAIGPSDTANQLRVWQVVIPYQIKVNSVGFYLQVKGGAGKIGEIAIYDSSKNLVVSSASFALDGAVAEKSATITTTTIKAGVYYIAWAVDEATTAFRFYGSVGATSLDPVYNTGESRWATAANLMSGGTMPSALGALTNITGTGVPIPILVFSTQ